MAIKEIIFRSTIKSSNRKNQNKRESTPYKDAKFIGILFNNTSGFKAAKPLIQELTNDGKTVKSLVYSKDKMQHFETDFFTKKETKWFGKIKSDKVEQFVKTPFDFLIYLSKQPQYPLEYILSKSHAKCRVGLFDEDKSFLFEFMMYKNTQHTEEKIYTEALNYIKRMK